MTSNYPPGVTGNEPEIAGPLAEKEEWRDCDATASLLIVPVDVDLKAIIFDLRKALDEEDEGSSRFGIKNATGRLALALALLHPAEDITCPFGGEVDVAYHHDGSTWTCPVCRTDYFEAKPERGD